MKIESWAKRFCLKQEKAKGWGDGPWRLDQLEEDAVIPGRFPLVQGDKVRVIDDYSISGTNDARAIHIRLDLRVIDPFVAAVRAHFSGMGFVQKDMWLSAKPYDLKSAYRQIPVREDNLKSAYCCVYNCETAKFEVHRSKDAAFRCKTQRLQFSAFGQDFALRCLVVVRSCLQKAYNQVLRLHSGG